MSSPRRPSVLFDLYVAAQLTGQLLELELGAGEIPAEDFVIYNAVVHFERVTPTQLAQHLGMPLSTLLFRFGKIEARGHGVRERNPRDRRSSLLGLSARGRDAFDVAKPRFNDVLHAIHLHMSVDRDAVQDGLADLARSIGAALAEARDRELVARKTS